jgi:hypothetical protein
MDADAAAYITAVETADGQTLEEKTKIAIDNFVLGCKADGIWTAIKASCILAGARTLAGALVPLAGTAPTNFNFVSATDYNRKTGLKGNGTTKYLNSNRNNNADPQNSKHVSAFSTITYGNNGGVSFSSRGNGTAVGSVYYDYRLQLNSAGDITTSQGNRSPGLYGLSRNSSSLMQHREQGITTTYSSTSTTPDTTTIVFYARRNLDNTISFYSANRFAFYSIGESLDLALLDARVTALINAFAAAIP